MIEKHEQPETADESLSITVTPADLRAGVPKDAFRCPLALALNREHGPQWRVTYTLADRDGTFYLLPAAATSFISRYDDGRTVEPAEFTLTPDSVTARPAR
jgi:hypothetical protein